jgi:uncharacterized protein
MLRQWVFDDGIVTSRQTADAAEKKLDEQEKFKMYYDYREPVKTIPSHRMLAIRRGETENVLYFLIETDADRAGSMLRSRVLRAKGDWTTQLELAIDDSWSRLLNSSIQAEIRLELKRRSDAEAIQVFRENLHNLLLAAPAGQIAVLGIDPGLRTGCKVAVVDETGKFLAHDVIYPHTGKGNADSAKATLRRMIAGHHCRAIAIGNGTASRETLTLVREFLQEEKLNEVFTVTVSESGASVYSASDLARQEFPDLDLTVRGAISIARRLQDPLAELVKVDPKAIGVGQYQHDVDQRQLQESLGQVIESCVNRVGVDLNTASWALLRYVAGISERTALNIIAHRDQNGRFVSREQLKQVSGVGPKTFEQAAGFLRIRGGINPLDSTAVHPESYALVEQIAKLANSPIDGIIRQPELLEKVDRSHIQAGAFTLQDILEELRKPGRDPRDKFVAPSFLESVHEISDLEPGMVLEGVVTNVTRFRRIRRHWRPSGWPRTHQRALKQIHQGPIRSCEGWPDREGQGVKRRRPHQASLAVHQGAAGERGPARRQQRPIAERHQRHNCIEREASRATPTSHFGPENRSTHSPLAKTISRGKSQVRRK